MSGRSSSSSDLQTGTDALSSRGLDTLERLLTGDLSHVPPVPRSKIKIYLCCNKTDFELERQKIWEECLPELQNHFLGYGVELQIVDIHQGCDVDHVYDRHAFDRHLREITNCYEKSIGHFFVALVGNKCGPVPLPTYIEEVEFQHIRNEAFEAGKDVKLLDKWYVQDANHIPPTYFLQPVSKEFEYFNDRNPEHASRRAADVSSWQGVFHRLQDLLQQSAAVCHREGRINQVNQYKQNRYFQSGMIQQVYHAMDLSPKKCLLFTRNIEGIPADSHLSKKFVDIRRMRHSVDKTAQEQLTNFKNDLMMKLNSKNQFHFSTRWQEGGIVPYDAGDHTDYLEHFHNIFCTTVKKRLEPFLISSLAEQTLKTTSDIARQTFRDVGEHMFRCNELAEYGTQVFPDLEMQLKQLLRRGSSGDPCETALLFGPEGCGKSVLISRLCQAASGPDTVVVVRYVGLTHSARTTWDILHSVCYQLGQVVGNQRPITHMEQEGLVGRFHHLLNIASLGKRNIVIVIDGVENFKGPLIDLDWIVTKLPPKINLFVTCSTVQSASEVYERLKGQISTDDFLLPMSPPDSVTAKQVVGEELAGKKRTLTKNQEGILTSAIQDQTRLMYLSLIETTLAHWSSGDTAKKTQLPSTLQEAINMRFQKMEKRFGSDTVGHVARYLSASYHGVTEAELLDLLSCNNDALLGSLPPNMITTLRFPHSCWLEIKELLEPLIEERWVHQKEVLHWNHACVAAVASHRYRVLVEDIKQSHKDMAELFLDTWVGNRPMVVPERGIQVIDTGCRFVTQQPLLYSEVRYNLRKINELWYQLLQAGERDGLKENALCNFEYLLASLHSTNARHLLSDLEITSNQVLDAQLVLIQRCIELGCPILSYDPLQLASEFIGRLRSIKDVFSCSIDNLVQQSMEWCDGFTLPLLVPLSSWLPDPRVPLILTLSVPDGVTMITSTKSGQHVFCATPRSEIRMYHVPSKKLIKTLTGHRGPVTCLCVSHNNKFVVSGSSDSTIRIWDLSSDNYQTIREHNDAILCLALTRSDELLVTGSRDKTVKITNLSTLEVQHTLNSADGPVFCVSINSADSIMVTAADKKVSLWSMEDMDCLNTLEEKISGRVTTMALSWDNTFLLLGCEDNSLHVRSFTTGSEIHELKGHIGKVESIAIANDSFHCVVGTSSGKVHLYNIRTTELLQTIEVDTAAVSVTSVLITKDEHFIFTAAKESIKVWTLVKRYTLQIDTVNHLDQVTTFAMSFDGKTAITGSKDKMVKMWNLEISDFTENLQGHEQAITCVCLANDEAFAVSGSMDFTVKVWSIMMGCVITDYKEHGSEICSVQVLSDCQRVLSAEVQGIIKVWMAENGSTLLTLDGPTDILHVSPNSQLAVSGEADQISLNVWCVSDGTQYQNVCHKDRVTCVSYSSDSQIMVTGSADRSLKVWEAATGKLTQVLVEHDDIVSCVAVTDNNRHVISGSHDKRLFIWTLPTGVVEYELRGHTDHVRCVKVTADGSTAISGSRDGTLRVWSICHGVQITVFDMHVAVMDLLITKDASRLVVRLEGSAHVPLMCLHNSPAAEVKSQSQISIQVNGDIPILPLRPKPLLSPPFTNYHHRKSNLDRHRQSVSSIPEIIKVSPIKAPLQKVIRAQEHNRETRSYSMLSKVDKKKREKTVDSETKRSNICRIV